LRRRSISIAQEGNSSVRQPVTPLVLHSIIRPSPDAPAIRDTALWIGLMVVFAGAGIALWGSWWAVPFFLAYGVLYGSSSDSRWHEAGHGTAFKSRWLDEAVYQIACFMMIMRDPTASRWSHTRHHTDTFVLGRDPGIQAMRPARLARILANFFGLVDVPIALRAMATTSAPIGPAPITRTLRRAGADRAYQGTPATAMATAEAAITRLRPTRVGERTHERDGDADHDWAGRGDEQGGTRAEADVLRRSSRSSPRPARVRDARGLGSVGFAEHEQHLPGQQLVLAVTVGEPGEVGEVVVGGGGQRGMGKILGVAVELLQVVAGEPGDQPVLFGGVRSAKLTVETTAITTTPSEPRSITPTPPGRRGSGTGVTARAGNPVSRRPRAGTGSLAPLVLPALIQSGDSTRRRRLRAARLCGGGAWREAVSGSGEQEPV
jgi:hypothetical protein